MSIMLKANAAVAFLINNAVNVETFPKTNLLTTYKLPQIEKIKNKYKYTVFLLILNNKMLSFLLLFQIPKYLFSQVI